jgi:hypothetical protein
MQKMDSAKSDDIKKISILDRILLLITGLLAAYQVGFGIGSPGLVPETSYMIAFGVLLVASLLIIILGFEILDSPVVVVVSTIIPLSLSMGIVSQFYSTWFLPYAIFGTLVFLLILGTRFYEGKTIKVLSVIVGHTVSGLIIFLMPLLLSFSGRVPALFATVGIGGALIGVGGILLSFQKMGKPVLSKNRILTILPSLLLLMMICFIVGFSTLV